MKYTDHTEWDNKAKQFIFKKRLKIEMLTKLIRHNITINILDNLIKATIKINNKLYQLQMIIKPSKPNKYYQNHNTKHYIIKKNHKSSINQYKNPINLNIIQKKKINKKDNFQKKI